jgi:type II secretory ATPase GspE/PulE/Tfp pilus assembly ATPase PilB-like protein
MDDEIAQLIMDQKPGYLIREKAIEKGMVTLLQNGINKVKDGETTLSEIIETLGSSRLI